MNWSDPLFLCSGITGLSLIGAAWITRKFPAKKINDLYGYRTARSKKNQEAWDFAQTYSGNLLTWIGIYNALIGCVGLFISFAIGWAIGISMTFLLASTGYLFWKTEGELKRRFGE